MFSDFKQSNSSYMIPKKKTKNSKLNRQGVAAVESAVVIPLLVLIFFGGISASHLLSLKHHATIIASSAAKDAMKAENTFALVETRYEALASAAGLNNVDVIVSRESADVVRVEVVVPVADNFTMNLSQLPSEMRAQMFTRRSAEFDD